MNDIPMDVSAYIKPDKKKEAKLIKMMSALEGGIFSVREGIDKMVEALYTIESQKLFYYDGCGSMTAFIQKNQYPERMSLSYNSIQRKLQVLRYLKDQGLDEDKQIKKIGQEKLYLMSTEDVTTKEDIVKLSKYSQIELKKKLGRINRIPGTGHFARKDFEKKASHKVLTWSIQVPNKYAIQLKKQINEAVKKCKAEII